jgi:hypothetical protein
MSLVAPRAVAAAALATALAGATAVVYGSVAVVPRSAPGQIALPVAFGAPLLLGGAALLALLVARRSGEVEAVLGLPSGALARRRRALVVGLLVAALVGALLLASDVWAYTTLGWAVPRGAPIFVG